jgi:membrane protein implicated in regulation of membrane protease activity
MRLCKALADEQDEKRSGLPQEKEGADSLKVTLVALILALVAVALLAFSDALHPWVPVGLLGAQIALLLSIPISLAFLAHRRAERLKTEEKQEQKPD